MLLYLELDKDMRLKEVWGKSKARDFRRKA
jgi:hypothetical protein